MASLSSTTTTTPSLRLVAALLLSIYATMARAVYFTEPPSYWTQDTKETPVEDLARTYRVGDTVQVTWNVGSFIIPNISLSVSQWTERRENVDYLLVDVFNNMVYSWVIGEKDGLTDEIVEKEPNYILRLTDPSGTHATTDDPVGFKGDSLWSRAFAIKPSNWEGDGDAYSALNVTSSSNGTPGASGDGGVLSPAAVAGLSVGCAIVGLIMGMFIAIKFGSRWFHRNEKHLDAEKAVPGPVPGPPSSDTPSPASERHPTRMPSWSDKPYWVQHQLPIGGAAIRRMALQRSPAPSTPSGSSIDISQRASPTATVSPLNTTPMGSDTYHHASLAAALSLPPYEPRLGDPDYPAEVAAWKLTPNTVYSSKMPTIASPMPPLDMLSMLTSPTMSMAERRHSGVQSWTESEEAGLTIPTVTVWPSESGSSVRSSSSASDEIRGSDRGRARWTGW